MNMDEGPLEIRKTLRTKRVSSTNRSWEWLSALSRQPGRPTPNRSLLKDPKKT